MRRHMVMKMHLKRMKKVTIGSLERDSVSPIASEASMLKTYMTTLLSTLTIGLGFPKPLNPLIIEALKR